MSTDGTPRPADVDDEAQPGKPFDERHLPRPQLPPAVGEGREVIHLAKVGTTSQLAGHELIERVQIAVGPEL